MTLIHSPKGELFGGRYHLIRQIGLGGTSKVYEAVHHLTEERVAIKVIAINKMKSEQRTIARFMREAKLPQEVTHQGVVRIHDAWIDDQQRCCLVMEHLNGVNLREAIRSGQMNRYDLFRLLTRILEPLEVVHRVGVIHRDLKPENIFLHLPLPAEGDTMVADDVYRYDEDSGQIEVVRLNKNSDKPRHLPSSIPPNKQERYQSSEPITVENLLGENFDLVQVKLLDFGLSRTLMGPSVTQTGQFVGTPWYMSPEQVFTPKSCTHQTDLWSMGVMLYEMLTNTVPFIGDSLPMVCTSIQEDPIDLSFVVNREPTLEPLIDTIYSCLERDIEKRIKSAAELKYRLESTLGLFKTSAYSAELIHGELYPTPSTQTSDGAKSTKFIGSASNYDRGKRMSAPPAEKQPTGQDFSDEPVEGVASNQPATLRLSVEAMQDRMKELRSLVDSQIPLGEVTESETKGSSEGENEQLDHAKDDFLAEYPLCDISIVSTEIADLPTLLTKERSPFYKKSDQVQLGLLNPESRVTAEDKKQGSERAIKSEHSEFDKLEEHHLPVMTFSQPPNRMTEENEMNQVLRLYKKKKRRADLWVVISLFIFGIGVGLLIRTFKLL